MADKKIKYNVAVIGAGPAGMMAAISAAQVGAKVILVEKNESAGKKLLLTGGGRCNFANDENDLRKLVANYGKNGQFLFHAFAEFAPKDTIAFFNGMGVASMVENNRRVLTKSGQAREILDSLVTRLRELDVEILFGARVSGFKKKDDLIENIILDSGEEIIAEYYIMATGGKSYLATGSVGDGYAWAKDLGHRIDVPAPALVPLLIKEGWVKDLSGLSLAAPEIAVFLNGKKQFAVIGECLFTHFGLSGPVILNASARIGKLQESGKVSLSINLFPGIDQAGMEKIILDNFKKNPNRTLKNSLSEMIRQNLAAIICDLSAIAPETTVNNITKEERRRLVEVVQNLGLTVSGLLDLEAGMVTEGGVDIKDIDDKTMRSKIIKNLLFAGEVISVHGGTGGFNLQQCWSTGYLAGRTAADSEV